MWTLLYHTQAKKCDPITEMESDLNLGRRKKEQKHPDRTKQQCGQQWKDGYGTEKATKPTQRGKDIVDVFAETWIFAQKEKQEMWDKGLRRNEVWMEGSGDANSILTIRPGKRCPRELEGSRVYWGF